MKKLLFIVMIAFCILAARNSHAQVLVSTYAGTPQNGGYTGDGDSATLARLASPSDVTVDKYGNLFIADFVNNVIRKVDTNGIISTFAGTGAGAGGTATGGYSGDNGPATAADMNGPFALTLDKNGNMFIADGYNHVVRKINTTGTITTIAGNHTAGYSGDGGPATLAQLNNPVGVAADSAGNIYVADDHNNVIRKITPAGMISTFAGDSTAGYTGNGGPATNARLNLPLGVAVDKHGNVFIADAQNNVVRKVDASGIITTVAGDLADTTHGYSGDEGPATSARLWYPTRIALDTAGNLYISDALNSVIRLVTPAGVISTYAGTTTSGYYGDGLPPDSAQFLVTYGVAISKKGDVFVTDRGNHIIRRIGLPKPTAVTDLTLTTDELKLFPNPADGGKCTVYVSSLRSKQVCLVVKNLIGTVVKTINLQTNVLMPIDSQLPPGIYPVSVMAADSKVQTVQKLVITD